VSNGDDYGRVYETFRHWIFMQSYVGHPAGAAFYLPEPETDEEQAAIAELADLQAAYSGLPVLTIDRNRFQQLLDNWEVVYAHDEQESQQRRALHRLATTPGQAAGTHELWSEPQGPHDALPDPPDWLAEESGRRQHLKQLMLSDETWLPELDNLDLVEDDPVEAAMPDGPDIGR
jgi:hypothetical protein